MQNIIYRLENMEGRNNKVAIFYPYMAHYRRAIFRKLSSQEHLHFTVYSDTAPHDQTLKVLAEDDTIRWRKINNYWLMKMFLFQPHSISNSLFGEEGTIIYLGDVHYISTWAAAVLARARGKKVLFWTHGSYSPERGIKGIVRRSFYRLANGLLLYGNVALKHLSNAGYPASKMRVIYNSLDYDEQKGIADSITTESRKSQRQDLFANPDLPMLLVMGRMVKRINYPLLLNAAKILIEDGFPVNVLIVGSGPEKEVVEKLVGDFSIQKHVKLYGACYSEELLGPLINAADMLVGPGSIGLSCIHSLVYGTPVITHSGSGPNERTGPEVEAITDGYNGMFFKKGDKHDLARVIRNWSESHPDREQVEHICKKSIYPEYTPDYQVREIVKFIDDIHSGA